MDADVRASLAAVSYLIANTCGCAPANLTSERATHRTLGESTDRPLQKDHVLIQCNLLNRQNG